MECGAFIPDTPILMTHQRLLRWNPGRCDRVQRVPQSGRLPTYHSGLLRGPSAIENRRGDAKKHFVSNPRHRFMDVDQSRATCLLEA